MSDLATSGYTRYYKSLIRLGVPIIIGQLGAIVTGLADTIMVGHHSTEELAAASFVNNVVTAFIVLGTGFSYNFTPLIGQNLALHKRIAIGGWLKNSLVANLTTTLLLLGALLAIFLRLDRLGQPEELMPLIRPYFAVSALSVLFVMLYNSFRQFVEGIANPTISMWILLSGNALNIAGNYILIYGKCGMPELGLFGAGLSTLTSRFVMLLLFVAVFLWRADYRPYRQGFARIRVNKARWRRLNAIGWPIGIQQGLEAGTFSATAIMVGWLGSLELAAHQIAIAISTVSYTVFLGLGSAVAIRVSYYKGANDWQEVRKITLAGLRLAFALCCGVCLTLYLARFHVGMIFTDNTEVNTIVIALLPILMLYQFGDSAQIILANALRGLADVRAIMWVSFIAYIWVAMPGGYLLGFVAEWGISGIWMAYPLGFLCAVSLLGRRAYSQIRSKIVSSRTETK